MIRSFPPHLQSSRAKCTTDIGQLLLSSLWGGFNGAQDELSERVQWAASPPAGGAPARRQGRAAAREPHRAARSGGGESVEEDQADEGAGREHFDIATGAPAGAAGGAAAGAVEPLEHAPQEAKQVVRRSGCQPSVA